MIDTMYMAVMPYSDNFVEALMHDLTKGLGRFNPAASDVVRKATNSAVDPFTQHPIVYITGEEESLIGTLTFNVEFRALKREWKGIARITSAGAFLYLMSQSSSSITYATGCIAYDPQVNTAVEATRAIIGSRIRRADIPDCLKFLVQKMSE